MDPSVTDVDESIFNLSADQKDLHRDVVEDDPNKIPEPLGKPVFVG